jgi:hypothetical protein
MVVVELVEVDSVLTWQGRGLVRHFLAGAAAALGGVDVLTVFCRSSLDQSDRSAERAAEAQMSTAIVFAFLLAGFASIAALALRVIVEFASVSQAAVGERPALQLLSETCRRLVLFTDMARPARLGADAAALCAHFRELLGRGARVLALISVSGAAKVLGGVYGSATVEQVLGVVSAACTARGEYFDRYTTSARAIAALSAAANSPSPLLEFLMRVVAQLVARLSIGADAIYLVARTSPEPESRAARGDAACHVQLAMMAGLLRLYAPNIPIYARKFFGKAGGSGASATAGWPLGDFLLDLPGEKNVVILCGIDRATRSPACLERLIGAVAAGRLEVVNLFVGKELLGNMGQLAREQLKRAVEVLGVNVIGDSNEGAELLLRYEALLQLFARGVALDPCGYVGSMPFPMRICEANADPLRTQTTTSAAFAMTYQVSACRLLLERVGVASKDSLENLQAAGARMLATERGDRGRADRRFVNVTLDRLQLARPDVDHSALGVEHLQTCRDTRSDHCASLRRTVCPYEVLPRPEAIEMLLAERDATLRLHRCAACRAAAKAKRAGRAKRKAGEDENCAADDDDDDDEEEEEEDDDDDDDDVGDDVDDIHNDVDNVDNDDEADEDEDDDLHLRQRQARAQPDDAALAAAVRERLGPWQFSKYRTQGVVGRSLKQSITDHDVLSTWAKLPDKVWAVRWPTMVELLTLSRIYDDLQTREVPFTIEAVALIARARLTLRADATVPPDLSMVCYKLKRKLTQFRMSRANRESRHCLVSGDVGSDNGRGLQKLLAVNWYLFVHGYDLEIRD